MPGVEVQIEEDDGGPAAPAPPREWTYLAELIGLSAVAIAQPVLDVIQGAPEEFVLRGAGAEMVVAYALVVGLGPPLLLWLLEQPVRLAGSRIRDLVHCALLGLLAALFVLAGAKSALGGEARPTLTFVGVLAVGGAAYLFHRFRVARQMLRYLALAMPVFLGLFLFASPVADLVRAGGVDVADVEVAHPDPVVVLILDELPVMSLLDGEGTVDEARFPAFAELAGSSTWYRNATTVAPVTLSGVPAIMTGQMPERVDDAPVATTYDESLFTLLGGSYEVRAAESITRVCPESVCGEGAGPSSASVLRSLLRTSTEILGDLVSPRVDERDVDFGVGLDESDMTDDLGNDRPLSFPQEPMGDGATLDVAHVVMPHQPWVWLRSGATYPAPHPARGAEFGVWFNQVSGQEGLQRHLLQLQYTDALLGEALDRLRAEPWYDDATIVVTADHGISFTGEQPIRGVTEGNFQEVLWVPLFVKYPDQQQGAVDDRDAETLDIVPTIADVLGVDLPWDVDGVSLLAEPQDRPARVVDWLTNEVPAVDGVATVDRDEGFARVLEAPGPAHGAPADDPDALLRIGPYGDLIGTPVDPGAVTDGAGPDLETTATATFSVPPAATDLPAYIEGNWVGEPGDWVAVAVDGVVAGVGQSFPRGEDGATFWTLLTERLVGPGDHDLDVYRVTGPTRFPTFQPLGLVPLD